MNWHLFAMAGDRYLYIYLFNFFFVQRTCLWTITNLIASGDKALKVLVDQEVTKSLSSVKTNALNDCIKEDALIAIDVALDSNVLRCVLR